MMKSLEGMALRFFRENKFIAFSSIVGVMLSITLIITMAIFAVNAKQSLRNEVAKMYGNMDLAVGYNVNQNKTIDQSLLNQLTSNASIEQFSNVLITRLKVNQLANAEIYTVGVENDSLAKSRYHFNQNTSDSEVMLNKRLAESLKVEAGDRILIENKPFTVKEVLADLEAAGVTPDMLILSKNMVRKFMYDKTGKDIAATYILMKAKNNSDVLTLANQIRQIDPDLRIDVAQEDEFLKKNMASLQVFMIVLSVLVLITTSLLIISNFEVFLYKYKNQFAIMRSIGATTQQMFKIVWLQSSLMNIAGSGGGLLLALFSNQLLQRWLAKLFSFDISTMVFNSKIALLVTLMCMLIIEIFMIIPSYRCSKVLPLKIIQQNEKNDFSHKKLRKKFGIVMLMISLILIAINILSVYMEQRTGVFNVLISAILLVIGIFILFPFYLSSILKRLLPVMKILLGKESFVAINNVIPQIRKNSFVILSISIMMIIAVFGSATLNTINKSEEQYLKRQYPTSILATSRLYYKSTVNHSDLRASINNITGVKGVSTLSTPNSAELKKGNNYVSFDYVLGDLKGMADQGLLPSITGDLKNIIIVTEDFAKKNKIKAGDTIELGLSSVEAHKIIPTGTLVANVVPELPDSFLSAIMDWGNTAYVNDWTKFNRAFISSDDPNQTLKQLEVLKSQFPEIKIDSYDQSLKQAKQMFYQRWSIFIVVLIVMMLCVMLGVFNTLINNIQSKRKEFAILRTISINKKGVMNVILTQVFLYIIVGSILGIALGAMLTYVLSLIDSRAGKVSFDFSSISFIVIVMLGMSFLIFIPYAHRIGKRSIALELTHDNK